MSVTPVTGSGNGPVSGTASTDTQQLQAQLFQALIQTEAYSVIVQDPADKSAAQKLVNQADHTTSITKLTQIQNEMNNLLASANMQAAATRMAASNLTPAGASNSTTPSQYNYDLAIANGVSPSQLGSSS